MEKTPNLLLLEAAECDLIAALAFVDRATANLNGSATADELHKAREQLDDAWALVSKAQQKVLSTMQHEPPGEQ